MKRGYEIYVSELLGPIGMVVSEEGVEEIFLTEQGLNSYLKSNPEVTRNEALCKEVKNQLEEYFLGKRLDFDVPIAVKGTPFRKQVWQALRTIPFGETYSYGEIAKLIGNPKACRAVGSASKANLLPLIIPCHRVVGASGKLVGFMGDKTEIKELLLAHERNILEKIKD